MAKKNAVSTKESRPDEVDAYLRAMDHPLKRVVEALRAVILSADSRIGEEVKWNAPAFFYTGAMVEFDPKKHMRHLVVLNLFKKDSVRLVFPSGARIGDTSGLLTGDYSDGRRLAQFSSTDEVRSRRSDLERAIRQWLSTLVKD
ncbi:DUF1801 domain-containing protein [Acidobacteria bacterium AB60]|nr:DUF1801 domain-containing protein [Acidobacteria bacterium AB60]